MIEQPAQFRPSPKHCLEGTQGNGVGRDDRIELGKRSPTVAPGTFLGEFLGNSDSVLCLECGYKPRENELGRRYAEHQGQAVQGTSQGTMEEDLAPDVGCLPIYPSPSACRLGYVPLLFSTAVQIKSILGNSSCPCMTKSFHQGPPFSLHL